MASLATRAAVNLLYHSPFNPKSTDTPDDAVVALVEGPDALPPGRALDLGCGSGRHALYLARRGWEVTGVDLVRDAVETARHKAAELGVTPRLIQGDVTELSKIGVEGGNTLIVDAGCFHGLPAKMRDAYVPEVTRLAAPGAALLILGLAKHPVLKGVQAAELRRRFRNWTLVSAQSVAGDEMLRYGDGSPILRKAFEKGWFDPWRYLLRRNDT
ncbi:MAG TPA: class I SAM-dependent methyltransferase [Amycolatopsis sp.]|nr:class I SAM-dependent methyltransferase [Amycolatopsis sp.]